MKPGIPWSIKGIESETREVAKAAAQRSGMTLGQWMNGMIQEQAETRQRYSEIEKTPPKKRRSHSKKSKKNKKNVAKKVSRIDDRLVELADQLMALSEQSQSTAVNRFIGHDNEPAVEQALDAMIERIERGESQTNESFTAVNTRLDAIDSKLTKTSKKSEGQSPELKALETALRNIVEHVETSENRNRDALQNMQERMSEMSKRAEQTQNSAVNQNAPAIAALDARIAELSLQLEQAADSSQNETRSYLEERLARVGEQIDAVRHSSDAMTKRAETSAVDAAKKEALEIEQRVASLIGEARTLIVKATSPGSAVNSMRGEIESLNQRFDDIKADSASDQDVQSLKLAVEQLTSNVSSGHDMPPVAAMEQRLAELTQRLDQTATADHMAPQVAELEQRIVGLDQQLAVAMGQQGDATAFTALESQIAAIGDRMSATEQKLGALTTIEHSIAQLYSAIEDNKTEVASVTEKTVSRMMGEFTPASAPAVSGASPELVALEQGLAAVKQSSRDAEQHNQETLEAVHETLEQIITKLADMEARDAIAADAPAAHSQTAQPQPSMSEASMLQTPAPALQEAPVSKPAESGNTDWQATVQSHLQESLGAEPASFDPGPVPQAPQQQAVPTEAAERSDLQASSLEDAANKTSFEQEVFEPETVPETETAPLDYIAQARLASKTATTQTKSPLSSGAGFIADKIRTGKKQDDADEQKKERKSFFSLPFLSKKAPEDKSIAENKPEAGKLETNKPETDKLVADNKLSKAQPADKTEQQGSRKRLLLAGLILLIAAGSFAVNKFGAGPASTPTPTVSAPDKSVLPKAPANKTPAPEKTSQTSPAAKSQVKRVSLARPQLSVPAPTAEQTGMPQGQALQAGNANADAVLPAPVDPITTASLPPAPQATQNNFAAKVADILPEAVGTQQLRQAAISGDASAQFVVATRYVDGKQLKRDYAKAALWYQKAASTGLAPAQYRLGTLFERGNGVPRDLSAARLWYERAAESGNVKSMHNLAVIYASPNNGQTDYTKAKKWFEKAANYGLKDSQYNLAVVHERGLIGQRNLKQAFYWYSLAAADGDRDAGVKANSLKKGLSAADIAQVEQQRSAWSAQRAPKKGNFVAIKDPNWRVASRRAAAPPLTAKPNLSGSTLIKKTQTVLSQMGFDIGKADGVMGSRTANAVRLFQLQNGLQVNGMVTNDLLQQLQARS